MIPKFKNINLAIILNIFLFIFFSIISFASVENKESIKFVYITDLNLYPTPLENARQKSEYEKKDGILLYETQAIFQEIIRYLNQKVEFDCVFFGGNNISEVQDSQNNIKNLNIWHLFLDMASELKTTFYLVIGKNETKVLPNNEIIHTLSDLGVDSKVTWWHKKIKDFLFVSLDSVLFFNSNFHAKVQIDWLKKILISNPHIPTIIFLHEPVITTEGSVINTTNIKLLLTLIEQYPQVKLIISGNNYLNRIKPVKNIVHILSSSPSIYPCSFKLIELSEDKVKVKSIRIPLKGIIKKAEISLTESERAKLFAPKSLKYYVLGSKSDQDSELIFKALKNR